MASSSPPHNSSSYWRTASFRGGRGWQWKPSTSPVVSRNAHLTACRQVGEKLPHPAIHATDKGNFKGRQAFLLLFFLTPPQRLSAPPSLSRPLSHAHSQTHSQAVISIPMNMNVNIWENSKKKKKEKKARKKVNKWPLWEESRLGNVS